MVFRSFAVGKNKKNINKSLSFNNFEVLFKLKKQEQE